MVDAWPNTLPQKFQTPSFSEGVGDGLVEYAPDEGPPITRRRTSAVVRPLIGTMVCTGAQIAIFRAFFDTTVLGGSLPFNFPDQIHAGTLLVKFLKSTLPKWTALGGDYYQLQLTLQVLP
jgi:hypothetical protein